MKPDGLMEGVCGRFMEIVCGRFMMICVSRCLSYIFIACICIYIYIYARLYVCCLNGLTLKAIPPVPHVCRSGHAGRYLERGRKEKKDGTRRDSLE